MKISKRTIEKHDPIGIVIAPGLVGNEPPRFAAYVWGPAPEYLEDLVDTKAA